MPKKVTFPTETSYMPAPSPNPTKTPPTSTPPFPPLIFPSSNTTTLTSATTSPTRFTTWGPVSLSYPPSKPKQKLNNGYVARVVAPSGVVTLEGSEAISTTETMEVLPGGGKRRGWVTWVRVGVWETETEMEGATEVGSHDGGGGGGEEVKREGMGELEKERRRKKKEKKAEGKGRKKDTSNDDDDDDDDKISGDDVNFWSGFWGSDWDGFWDKEWNVRGGEEGAFLREWKEFARGLVYRGLFSKREKKAGP